MNGFIRQWVAYAAAFVCTVLVPAIAMAQDPTVDEQLAKFGVKDAALAGITAIGALAGVCVVGFFAFLGAKVGMRWARSYLK